METSKALEESSATFRGANRHFQNMETPKPRNQPLWDHMVNEHDLHLLDSEIYEIELIVARMLADDGESEPALRSSSELACSEWIDEVTTARDSILSARRNAPPRATSDEEWNALYEAVSVLTKILERNRSTSSIMGDKLP
jgi:hypothetical protein